MIAEWRYAWRIPRYKRLLLAFGVLIGAVPVLALGLFSYYIAAGDVEEKTKEGNMQLLRQTQMRVEQAMKTLELTAIQYANSPQVASAMNEPLDVSDFIRVRNLYTGLANLQTLPGISEGYLIGIQEGWAIGFTSVIPLAELPFRDRLEHYAKQPNALFWDIGAPQPGPDGEIGATGSPTIRMVYKLPILPFTQQPKGYLVIEMLKSQFSTLLAAENDRLGDIYVIDSEGVDFIYGNDLSGNPYGPVNARIAQAAKATGSENGFWQEEVDGREMVFSYRFSPYNRWIYVSAVSLEQITRETGKIAVATFVACSVILVIVGILAWQGSRRMYSPIRRLSQMTAGVQAGGADPADEFTSLEERFRTLFSAGQQLQQQMQGQFQQLKEFLVLKLFAGQLSESDFAYRSRLFGFPTEWRRLVVLTLQIDTLQDTRYREHDKELLLFAIHNMVSEIIPANLRFSPVLLEQSQVTLLAGDMDTDEELKAYCYRMAEQIRAKVWEFLQVQVSIGISRPFDKASEAVRAYNEGLEALKRRIYLGNRLILHYDDIQAEPNEAAAAAYTQLKWNEEQLVKALKLGDAEQAEQCFDRYMAELVTRNPGVGEYHVYMMQLVSRMCQLIQEQGGIANQVLGERALYKQLMKLNTVEDISDWFKRELLAPVLAFLNRQAESQYAGIVQRMVSLVQQRYDQDITLEACAAELNFHPVYLSRVFKKEMGIPFSEYLAEYRMNLAKEWLDTTTMKLSDISERLNYSNTTAFIRMFRKVVGMTPGQYRERNEPK
ncbi:helix-turn-helix domain-containing protein [Paenibacillus ginsengihumi]|uniref:helix-turn-helix domain-containing protein n=1 Tax=Paenibacillus ginsengihumi TaxID=431596 RepID=UPI0003AA1828|nr:helix-turn-helix domain-containing protein [Paenibacillus ginsengihumi]